MVVAVGTCNALNSSPIAGQHDGGWADTDSSTTPRSHIPTPINQNQ